MAATKALDLRPGMTVRVHHKIKEGGKERIQVFEGIILQIHRAAEEQNRTFTVRKIVEGIGVEKIFPMHTPVVAKIEVTHKAKVRRAKLYYLRKRRGKSARLSSEQVDSEVVEKEQAKEEVATA